MLPLSIRWFQRLLLAAVAIDLANNLGARSQLAAVFAGVPPLLLFGMCLLPPVVGLIGWYLVVRRRSNFARWAVTMLVLAAATAMLVALAIGQVPLAGATLIALSAIVLKLAAVTRLHVSQSRTWFAVRRGYSTAA